MWLKDENQNIHFFQRVANARRRQNFTASTKIGDKVLAREKIQKSRGVLFTKAVGRWPRVNWMEFASLVVEGMM